MPHFITYLFITILPFIPQLLSSLVVRGAVTLGMGTASFYGVNLIFDSILSKLQSELSGLPSNVINMIALVGIPDAINIALSAGFALLTFKGMSKMGQMRKVVWRKGGDKSPIDWGA